MPVSAKVIQLIAVENPVGQGTESDPVRTIVSLFTPDGRFVANLETYQLAPADALVVIA